VSGFLLDTDIVSELVKPRPEPAVAKWIDAADENLLWLSVLTFFNDDYCASGIFRGPNVSIAGDVWYLPR